MPRKAPSKTATQDRHANRLRILNQSVADVCNRIGDSSKSYTDKAIRSRSVDPKVVAAGFDAIEASLKDARARYAASQRDDDVARVARVDLTAV